MNDSLISRQAAIDLAKDLMIPGADYLQHNQAIMNYEAELVRLTPAQPEPSIEAIKDCRNCKHLKYNDYHNEHFCYNTEDCLNFDMWKPEDPEPYRAERRTDD